MPTLGVSIWYLRFDCHRVCLIGEHIDYSGYSVITMAVDRYCCCALRCRQPAGISTVLNDNNTDSIAGIATEPLDADALSATQGHSRVSLSIPAEATQPADPDAQHNAECEGFLAVRHSNGAEFPSLTIPKVELIFPTLQAILQQGQCGAGCCEPPATSCQNGWHAYVLAGCLGALEFFVSRSALSAGSITSDSWDEFVGRLSPKLPKISIRATISGNLPLVRTQCAVTTIR